MTASVEKLKRLIEEAGLRQKDVAELMGLSEATVSRLLSGETERDLTVSEAEAVLAGLRDRMGRKKGLTLNDLIKGEAA